MKTLAKRHKRITFPKPKMKKNTWANRIILIQNQKKMYMCKLDLYIPAQNKSQSLDFSTKENVGERKLTFKWEQIKVKQGQIIYIYSKIQNKF